MMPIGPSRVPMAANSFTSPAPVAPTKWPGSISAKPSANPASAAGTLTLVRCVAASARPRAAIPSVNGFGTRRLLRSMSALNPPLPATTPTTITSESLSNGRPEHRHDRLSERGQSHHYHHGDQDAQKPVLDQVLAIVATNEAADGGEHVLHLDLAKECWGGDQAPPRDHRYDAGANAAAMLVKIVLTFVPAEVMAATQTSAMRATSNAYSSKSCPSSSRASVRR